MHYDSWPLGHASIQLTLDTYSHLIPSMQEDAAALIDEALRKAMKQANGSKAVAIARKPSHFQRRSPIS